MKTQLPYERLIDDVILDEELCSLREQTLDQCLATLGRRRARTYRVSALAAVAAMLVLAFILWQNPNNSPKHTPAKGDEPYLVRSTPLTRAQVVRSQEMDVEVNTQSLESSTVASVFRPEVLVQKHYQIARITDNDLMNTFDGVPCGIIRSPGGEAKFVFFKAEDTLRFFANP